MGDVQTGNGLNWGGKSTASVRLVLDEDVPSPLAEHLRARGIDAVPIFDLKGKLGTGPGSSLTDDDVCKEVSSQPSVLVTLNVRDYADLAFIRKLVETFRISVVIVRPPKKEAGKGQRGAAIHDIVHRQAHKIVALYDGPPQIVSANRGTFRKRAIDEIPIEKDESKPAQTTA